MKSATNPSGKTSKKAAKKGDLEPKLKKPVLYLLSSNSNSVTKQLLKSLYQLNREHGIFRVDSGGSARKNKGDSGSDDKGSTKNDSTVETHSSWFKLTINAKNHRLSEMICSKLNLGLYVVANSNKKRPISMGFGRLYNGQVLDCCQMKVIDYRLCEEFKSDLGSIDTNSRPLVIAQGSQFSQESGPLNTLRNILFDIFRGPNYGKLSLENVKHVIVLTVLDDSTSVIKNISKSDTSATSSGSNSNLSANTTINSGNTSNNTTHTSGQHMLLFRRYAIALTKSPTTNSTATTTINTTSGTNTNIDVKLPKVTLKEVGPSIDFLVEEIMEANEETYKSATKMPKQPKKLVAGVSVPTGLTTSSPSGKASGYAGTGGEKVSATKVRKSKSKRPKKKNLRTTALGSLEGKVYVNRQDLGELYTRHSKPKRSNKPGNKAR